MANTALSIKEDPFCKWLIAHTALSSSSVEKYARAVRTISREMLDHSVIATPLHSMSAFDIDIAVPAIMCNPIFMDKNSRGNHMYSNALKQYRMFLNAYAGSLVQAFRRSWCIDSGHVVHTFR